MRVARSTPCSLSQFSNSAIAWVFREGGSSVTKEMANLARMAFTTEEGGFNEAMGNV